MERSDVNAGSPLRTNVGSRGLSINLFASNASSALGEEDSSVDIPSSYMGDDSTVSSWPTSPRNSLDQRTCCNLISYRYYSITTLLVASVLFVWASVLGFVWGVLLSLGAIIVHLAYFRLLLRGVQPPVGVANTRKQRCLHYTVLLLSYVIMIYMLIRLATARNTYVRDNVFPSNCYPNALGTVPHACVRVTERPAEGEDWSHGLSAPTIFTPEVDSVVRLVDAWTRKQFQTKVVGRRREAGKESVHLVAVTGFWGFVDDVAVEVACVGGGRAGEGGNGTVVVRVQSEQRFGTLDGGKNKDRVKSLLSFLERKAGGLPVGACSPTPPR